MLRELTPGIWEALDDLFLPGGLHFPVRMTIVRLAGGGLWVHSPIEIDAVLAAEIDGLGPVEHLVAPNKLHHFFLRAAAERYPGATVWAAPGLRAKVDGLPSGPTLGVDDAPWADELSVFPLEGVPWMNETMFFHRASGTALATDLFFHMTAPANWGSRFFFRLLGVLGRPRQSPLVRLQTKDRGAAGASLARLLAERPSRFVVAHGPAIESDVTGTVQQACSWMLSGVTAPLAISTQ